MEHDTMLSGDGMISRFSIQDGHVDFAIRYVETERYKLERNARRALFGDYRNPFTDDPAVHGKDRTVANTTPVWHAGKLLMAKEDGLPYQIDPTTLETIGRYDFGGKLRSLTFTAHPKVDPVTGEMFCFGYQVDGLASRKVAYCIVDADGNLTSEQWFDAPYSAMIHDFAITEHHVIFPVFPTTANAERMRQGGAHWIHEPETESWIAIMPRYGTVDQLCWYRGPRGTSGFHVMNAFEADGFVHLDMNIMETNIFPFIRAASGIDKSPADIRATLTRWSFNVRSPTDTFEERPLGPPGDMPRVADADIGRPYRVGYYATYDPQVGPPLIHGVVGAGFNALLRIEPGNGRIDALALAPDESVSEPVHIAASNHEGWLVFVVDNHTCMSSALWIVEAGQPQKGAIAKVPLPVRLRPQIHGTWVDTSRLEAAHA